MDESFTYLVVLYSLLICGMLYMNSDEVRNSKYSKSSLSKCSDYVQGMVAALECRPQDFKYHQMKSGVISKNSWVVWRDSVTGYEFQFLVHHRRIEEFGTILCNVGLSPTEEYVLLWHFNHIKREREVTNKEESKSLEESRKSTVRSLYKRGEPHE